jgi:hypothetical protein
MADLAEGLERTISEVVGRIDVSPILKEELDEREAAALCCMPQSRPTTSVHSMNICTFRNECLGRQQCILRAVSLRDAAAHVKWNQTFRVTRPEVWTNSCFQYLGESPGV